MQSILKSFSFPSKLLTKKMASMSSKPKLLNQFHLEALLHPSSPQTTYIDPLSTLTVFTSYSHLQRGRCCGNCCRHCPFDWEGVSAKRKVMLMLEGSPDCGGIGGCSRKSPNSVNQALAKLSTLRQSHNGNNDDDTKIEVSSGSKKTVPYTRTGDKGTSRLMTGATLPKSDFIFVLLGEIDHLCSLLGVLDSTIRENSNSSNSVGNGNGNNDAQSEFLAIEMSRLFDVGSEIGRIENLSEGGDVSISISISVSNYLADLEKNIESVASATGNEFAQMDCVSEIGGVCNALSKTLSTTPIEQTYCGYFTRLGEFFSGSSTNSNTSFDLTHQSSAGAISSLQDRTSHILHSMELELNQYESENEISESDGRLQRDIMMLSFIVDELDAVNGMVTHHNNNVNANANAVDKLESFIDAITMELPELHNFVLPTGSLQCAQLHVARTLCRRAERCLVDDGSSSTDPSLSKFINRLSDFLFTLARSSSARRGFGDVKYVNTEDNDSKNKKKTQTRREIRYEED